MGFISPNTLSELQQIEQHKRSLEDPHGFWMKHALDLVDWDRRPTVAIDSPGKTQMHKALWFPDGKLNVCYNAVDRHVLNGRGDQAALIYDSPVSDTIKRFTYNELLRKVKAFASVLRRHGIRSGDTVLLYMAMVPQTLIAMLACARLGAIHSVV
ncbi:hypothetical protein GGI23_004813, partial [Coemansia sp. RSA 2559]